MSHIKKIKNNYNSIARIIFKNIECMKFLTYELCLDIYKDKGLSWIFSYISQVNIPGMLKARTAISACQKSWPREMRWKKTSLPKVLTCFIPDLLAYNLHRVQWTCFKGTFQWIPIHVYSLVTIVCSLLL